MTAKIDLTAVMKVEDTRGEVWDISSRLRGFLHLPTEMQVVFAKWRANLAATYQRHGFCPFDVSPFVHRRHIVRKGGIDAEIFSINRFPNNEMTSWALAYDRTVPFALWVSGQGSELTLPFKRFDINLSFRDEPNKPGRLNGFYQADVDVVGKKLPLSADVECITTLVNGLMSLGVPAFTVYLNHLEIIRGLIQALGITKQEECLRYLDKLDKVSSEEVIKWLVELEPTVKADQWKELVEICKFRGKINEFPYLDKLGEEGRKHFDELSRAFDLLARSGVDPEILRYAPGTVRGLNYYTGIVFETYLNRHEKFGSVMSGGRYDELVDAFCEKPTGIMGVGGSIGLSRLFDVLMREELIPCELKTACKVLVISRGQEFFGAAVEITAAIRRSQIDTEMYSGSEKFKAQLDYGNKIKVPVVVMVMNDNGFVIRDMRSSQQTEDLSGINHVARKVCAIVAASPNRVHTVDKSKGLDLDSLRILTIEDLLKVVKGLPIALSDRANDALQGAGEVQALSNSSRGNIGHYKQLDQEVVKGAMMLIAHSMASGQFGGSVKGANTLTEMVNKGVIPVVASDESGDHLEISALTCIRRAMCGEDVLVSYQGKVSPASSALASAGIDKVESGDCPIAFSQALAISLFSLSYLKEVALTENLFALLTLFASATGASTTTSDEKGVRYVTSVMETLMKDSPFVVEGKTIDLAQVIGPQLALISGLKKHVEEMLNGRVLGKEEFAGQKVLLLANLLLQANHLMAEELGKHLQGLGISSDTIKAVKGFTKPDTAEIVEDGLAAAYRLSHQIGAMKELLKVYLGAVVGAYAKARASQEELSPELFSEMIFKAQRGKDRDTLLDTTILREAALSPITEKMGIAGFSFS